jgi:hypothetical protein
MIANAEPRTFEPAASPLDRMLQDPLIRLVMASDGVEEADIRSLASRLALHAPSSSSAAPGGLCAGCA